jgi:hypothetical protein
MSYPVRYPLTNLEELAGGARDGGRFVGPKTDTSALWKGRPPVNVDGIGPMGMSISLRNESATPGVTVTIDAEAGTPYGGLARRIFQVGEGISAELHVGSYPHVNVRAVTPIPAGCTLYFTWVYEILGRSPLLSFFDYTAPASIIELPEGCEAITVQNACTLVFQVPQFTSTFTYAAVAGERVNALWSAVSCNVANRFIFHMRGI